MKALCVCILLMSIIYAEQPLIKDNVLQLGSYQIKDENRGCELSIKISEHQPERKNSQKVLVLNLKGTQKSQELNITLGLLSEKSHLVDAFYLRDKRITPKTTGYNRLEVSCSSQEKHLGTLIDYFSQANQWRKWSRKGVDSYKKLNKKNVQAYKGGPDNELYYGLNVRFSTLHSGNFTLVPEVIQKQQKHIRGIVRLLNDMGRTNNKTNINPASDEENIRELKLYLIAIFVEDVNKEVK